MNFVELHARTAFSFGDGTATPEALVARAAELGYAALGVADAADLGGTIRFALAAERHGIRPVIGAELCVDGHPAVFLTRDEEGYHNLAGLVTRARRGQRRGRPGIAWAQLVERGAGLHALTGPATGEIARLLRENRQTEAAWALARWREAFPDRLAVEVQMHRASGAEAALAAALIALAEANHVPWVVANAPRYLDGGGRLLHDLQTALRAGTTVHEAAERGLLLPNGEWKLRAPTEVTRLWRGREAGIAETQRIAGECSFSLRWLRPPLPQSLRPAGHTDDSYLRELAFAGARERWGNVGERERHQLEHELRVIGSLGFGGFFLVMWDAVRFARSRGILCQGRGSAANSVVAYCLGITAVDPVRNGLLFERFLSEARTDGMTEAPDIDVDFEMHRREEVLDYMYGKYSREHAAIACVTQTYHAPSALQDAMRALGYPAELARRLSKRLHHRSPAEGADLLKAELAKPFGLELEDARGRALLTALRTMDDLPRLRSTHPGGFVLSSAALGDYMPIEGTTMGRTILQFDKDDLDAAGVPKFDFLGLGGLSAIRLAFDAVEQRTGERLELYRLPPDDTKTFAMIAEGNTVGTFQIESRAQIQSILKTRPETLYDLVVQVALIRPGPIQARFVHPYTRRRRGQEPVSYAHPALEPILQRTQGIPIFQEQAMALSMALGGFTAAEADELRRAMGHQRKLPRLLGVLQQLQARMEGRGVARESAKQIIEDLHSFANYGFPESHAWSFALIAYATAYLKAHFPTEFYLGMLNAWPMGFYSPATLVHDARRNGVVVLPPCLKQGQWECVVEHVPSAKCQVPSTTFPSSVDGRIALPFTRSVGEERKHAPSHVTHSARLIKSHSTNAYLPFCHSERSEESVAVREGFFGRKLPQNDSVRMDEARSRSVNHASLGTRHSALGTPALRIGWRHIRGLGEKTRQALQDAYADAPFQSVEDVVRRARLGRAEALHLARAGAFEAFEPGRRAAAWEALRAVGDTLPLAPAPRLPFRADELEGAERIFLDYLATGISTEGHPVEHLRPRLRAAGIRGSMDLEEAANRSTVTVAGLVVARQHPSTAKGTVFVLLEDEGGFINIIVPAALYRQNKETVRFSPFLLVQGKLERDGRLLDVVGRRFRSLEMPDIASTSHDFH